MDPEASGAQGARQPPCTALTAAVTKLPAALRRTALPAVRGPTQVETSEAFTPPSPQGIIRQKDMELEQRAALLMKTKVGGTRVYPPNGGLTAPRRHPPTPAPSPPSRPPSSSCRRSWLERARRPTSGARWGSRTA